MTKEKTIKALCEAYGAKDFKHLENIVGYSLNITNVRGWMSAKNGDLYVHMDFIEPFFASMTNTSSAIIGDTFSDEEIVKSFKSKVKYKESQSKLLNERKAEVIKEARQHFSKSFSIDPALIADEHIKFRTYKMIELCDIARSFRATMSSTGVVIENYGYHAPGDDVAEFNALYKFYYGKDLSSITNFKPK